MHINKYGQNKIDKQNQKIKKYEQRFAKQSNIGTNENNEKWRCIYLRWIT